MLDNIIKIADSYLISHPNMQPKGLTYMKAYFEARSPHPDMGGEVVFFGLQYLIKRYLSKPITLADIIEAREFFAKHFGSRNVFDESRWQYILDKHGGRLPLRINAVPEGTVVPVGNLLFSVENTDPNCAWLVGHVETLLVEIWYPCTVGTLSRKIKSIIHEGLLTSCDDDRIAAALAFRLHDFGYRGTSSCESAALGGAAHLLNFMGTDTLAGIELLEEYYHAENLFPGYSIPATAHVVGSMLGPDGEAAVFQNVLDAYPDGLLAVVIDSFDMWNFVNNLVCGTFKERILNRNGMLVLRPDSGDPLIIIPRLLKILDSAFGATVNSKGYRVLNDKIRIIWGDGINLRTIRNIVACIIAAGYSVENVAFGCGGALLQKVNRDDFAFAYKACSAKVDGQIRNVYKNPSTDSGKRSKSGDLGLFRDPRTGEYATGTFADDRYQDWDVATQRTFRNGELLTATTLEEMRQRAEV